MNQPEIKPKKEHTTIDVSQNPAARKEVMAGLDEGTECTGLAPMIFNDDQYIGQYNDFFAAKEADTLFQFFKLEPPENSREKAVWNRANKPPTPEPEPEPENEGPNEETGESSEVAEEGVEEAVEEAAEEGTEEVPEENADEEETPDIGVDQTETVPEEADTTEAPEEQ